MVGPEVHLGIPLKCVLGNLDNSTVIEQNVPQNELRVEGEKNPIKKAKGNVCIILSKEQARNLASTLIYYAQCR